MAAAAQTTKSGASESTLLAVDRTRLAHDRTMMAWIRTAVSLISFGFTIYKFFEFMRERGVSEFLQQKAVAEQRPHVLDARHFAGTMICFGLIALVLATVQHTRDMIALRKSFPKTPYSLATVLAALIAIIGVAALLAVVLRK